MDIWNKNKGIIRIRLLLFFSVSELKGECDLVGKETTVSHKYSGTLVKGRGIKRIHPANLRPGCNETMSDLDKHIRNFSKIFCLDHVDGPVEETEEEPEEE